jgi:transposase-like protein
MGPLSVDWRERVVSAVREEGMSCRAAAKRFGVSFASAIRWVAALRERGSCAPLPRPTIRPRPIAVGRIRIASGTPIGARFRRRQRLHAPHHVGAEIAEHARMPARSKFIMINLVETCLS